MAGIMAWLNTIQEDFRVQEPFDDKYQTLAEEHYFEMARKSAESRNPPASATGTVEPVTGITEPSAAEKNCAFSSHGADNDSLVGSSSVSTSPTSTDETVNPKTIKETNSDGVRTENVTESSPLSSPPTSTEKTSPVKNASTQKAVIENSIGADPTKAAGRSKTVKTSKKRKTAPDADSQRASNTSKRLKSPQNTGETDDAFATNAVGSSVAVAAGTSTGGKVAAQNGTGLNANNTAGPSETTKTSGKRDTADNTDLLETPNLLQKWKEPTTVKEAVEQATALNLFGAATSFTGTALGNSAQNGAGADTNIPAGPAKSDGTSKKRKAVADADDDDDDGAAKQTPAKKTKKFDKGWRPIEEIKKEWREEQAAKQRAQDSEAAAKQEELAHIVQDTEAAGGTNETDQTHKIAINNSSANNQSQELDQLLANTLEAINGDNEAGEATNDTRTRSAKKTKKRKADDLAFVEPETSKRIRRKTAKASDAAPPKPRKIASKGTKKTTDLPPAAEDALQPPPATELSAALQAKLTQVNAFILAHPETNFSRISNTDLEALTLSEITLQGVAQLMYTHYDIPPSYETAEYPLVELESLVLARGADGEDDIKWPVTLEVLGVSRLEERVQQKIQGHGMEVVNLLKVEIEIAREREEQVIESGGVGFRVFERQVDSLLNAADIDEDANEDSSLVARGEGGERVLGVCPRSMAAV